MPTQTSLLSFAKKQKEKRKVLDPPLIAVLAFIAFINGLLSWFCALVGYDGVTIEFILGKIFIPFAWFMGVEYDNLESGFYSPLIFSFPFSSWIGMAELLHRTDKLN